jgi:hypothetical protein
MTRRMRRWRLGIGCISAAALIALTLSACGGGGSATEFDGSWSGKTSTAGTITFTVSNNKITSYRLDSGASPFGSACSQQGGTNEVPTSNVKIIEDRFSWGGPGEGWPVKGRFESATSASGSAEFSPDLVLGKIPSGCSTNSATWKATKTSG